MTLARQPHEKATREDLQWRLVQSRQLRVQGRVSYQALSEKTLALYRAYRVHGCLGPPDDNTNLRNRDLQDDEWAAQVKKARRGHDAKLTCNGQLIFDYDHTGKAFVR